MKLDCVIVEDEPLALDVLKEFVDEVSDLNLKASLTTGMEAYNYLLENQVDLLFLDIEMPKLQGNDLLKSLPYQPCVIFTTAYSQYALESFDYNTIDYLTKPIGFPRFLKAVKKAFQYLEQPDDVNSKPDQPNEEGNDFLFLKFSHYYQKIRFADILWIEGLADYQKIITANNFFFYYSSLKKLEDYLPVDQFMRVHHSYLVNVDHVEAFQGNRIFIQGHDIPISRKYRDEVKSRLGIG